MNSLSLILVFLLGVVFGYPFGRWATVKVLGPLIRKMSERIRELEELLIERTIADEQKEQLESIPTKAQVEILESWMRKQL